jgi:hypothetical protein
MTRTIRWYALTRSGRAALWALYIAAAVTVLMGCTTIDMQRTPPVDFPSLAVRIHAVDGGAVIRACYKYVALGWKLLGAIPEGCAEVDFEESTCTIYLRGDYPSKRVLDHELLHCRGYDHPGESSIRDAWEAHRKELLK